MKKPLILVSPLYDREKDLLTMQESYISPLIKAGATPIIVPFGLNREQIADLARLADGYLFTGGPDIHPNLYGEALADECGAIVPCRDALELQLFQQAYTDDKPIFGICRGFQLINTCLGGTLYQDLPTAGFSSVTHRDGSYPESIPMHNVSFPEETLLRNLLGAETAQVNTYHHQAVKQLAPSMKALAFADDGITEAAVCEDKKFLLGVQWHPERMDNDLSNLLWTLFVNAARG